MVLKIEQLMETIATKNGMRILRFLLRRPYLSFGLSELSSILGVSKSNILRYFEAIKAYNLVQVQRSGRKKLYRINSGNEICRTLWQLFMVERKNSLKPVSKNIVDHIFEIVKGRTDVFILFGSVAYGLESEESDIDILVIGDNSLKNEKLSFLPNRVEFHVIKKEDLEKTKDFMVLEAIMNGIVYKGDTFSVLSNLRSFPKSYVLFRLQKAKEYLSKASKLKAHAKTYYKDLAEISLGEIEALLLKKSILPKKLVDLKTSLDKLEELISKEGDGIWLT